jgi:hypothetical protein
MPGTQESGRADRAQKGLPDELNAHQVNRTALGFLETGLCRVLRR